MRKDSSGYPPVPVRSKQAVGLLSPPEELLRVLDAISDVVFRIDIEPDGYRFSYINRSFLQSTGLRRDQVQGRRVEDVIPEPSLQLALEKYRHARDTGETVRWVETTAYPAGIKRGEVMIEPLKDERGKVHVLVGTVHDVTAAYNHEERLRQLAYTDALTGLPNRRHFYMLLHERIATRPGTSLALLYVDLAIHYINDTYGHDFGDEVLRQAAVRITDKLGEHALVGRLAGDELAVLLPRPADERNLAEVANGVLTRLEAPFALASQEAMITPSIGVALYPHDAADANDLVRAGNAAMHAAKQAGRSAVRFYDGDLAMRIRQRISVRNRLQQALDQGRFVLHYQPQIDTRTGHCVSLEALLRWQRAENDLVMPGEFIDVLEQSSLIVPVGFWVIENACRQLQAWKASGLPPVAVSLNVSARQLMAQSTSGHARASGQVGKDSLYWRLAGCLEHYGIEPGQLELELTETSLMADPERSAVLLEQFRSLGLRVLIDDFGTGYSSLAYLRRLPIDMLKIDGEFVSDIKGKGEEPSEGAAIADLIIKLAHGLDIGVVAEGVETLAQAEYLYARGCERLQGYYLARPMPAGDVADFLHRQAEVAEG